MPSASLARAFSQAVMTVMQRAAEDRLKIERLEVPMGSEVPNGSRLWGAEVLHSEGVVGEVRGLPGREFTTRIYCVSLEAPGEVRAYPP